jgi:hypothetical protein
MHHVEVTPLLQLLLVVLLFTVLFKAMVATDGRGRLALLSLVLVCSVSNPDQGRHVTAIQHELRARAEYHNFVLASATTMDGRLVSVGWLGSVFVARTGRLHRER